MDSGIDVHSPIDITSPKHPLGFNLINIPVDDIRGSGDQIPYIEVKDVPRAIKPFESDQEESGQGEPDQDHEDSLDENSLDDPSFRKSVTFLTKSGVGSGPLTPYLSPLEAALCDDGSNGFNTSRIHEAPHVPNCLRVAIQQLDYVTSRDQVVAQLENIKDAIQKVEVGRGYEYFLGFGRYFGVEVEGRGLIPLLPPCSLIGSVDFRSGYSTIQYLVPMKLQPMAFAVALRRLLNPKIIPEKVSIGIREVLKSVMYHLASVEPPAPVNPRIQYVRDGSIVPTVQIESLDQNILPNHGSKEGYFILPDHPGFKEGCLNVVLFPTDKF